MALSHFTQNALNIEKIRIGYVSPVHKASDHYYLVFLKNLLELTSEANNVQRPQIALFCILEYCYRAPPFQHNQQQH